MISAADTPIIVFGFLEVEVSHYNKKISHSTPRAATRKITSLVPSVYFFAN